MLDYNMVAEEGIEPPTRGLWLLKLWFLCCSIKLYYVI